MEISSPTISKELYSLSDPINLVETCEVQVSVSFEPVAVKRGEGSLGLLGV